MTKYIVGKCRGGSDKKGYTFMMGITRKKYLVTLPNIPNSLIQGRYCNLTLEEKGDGWTGTAALDEKFLCVPDVAAYASVFYHN